ncbi:MAG: DUF421 domain-containing protein [Bacteroidia bacterium]|nr:DUF421 domain-containing protein [Bacteroidia bacterium]
MSHYVEIIVRCVGIYLFMIFAIRLFGKKELAQLSVIDLVFILLISNSVQNGMIGPDDSWQGAVTAALALFLANHTLKLFLFSNKKAASVLQGDPVMLILNGNIIEENLRKQHIQITELEAAAREHGVSSLNEVNLAVLETDGNISILSDDFQKKTSRHRKAHKIISKNEQG